jgi:hypothetical protein
MSLPEDQTTKPVITPLIVPPELPHTKVGSSSTSVLIPTSVVHFKRILGRLTKIEIQNYRAFRGHFQLDLPDGCNLLAYGENGAGKSSLFHALKDFLENPERRLKIDGNRHVFNTEPAFVRLSFAAISASDGKTIIDKPYEWSGSKNDSKESEMRTVNKGKGFLDYKALLRIHLLPKGEQEVDLFDLFINPLLADYKNPITGLTFATEWEHLQRPFVPRVWKPFGLETAINNFNAGFERVVKDAVASASTILSDFDRDLAVDVKVTAASYTWRPKKLLPPKIILTPSFKRLQREGYSEFLNEARLSALAIAIYFSSLKQSPVGTLGLLILDDILIGLDMANRMVVLGMVEKMFREWQVIILTYHKAWFEILKARLNDEKWPHDWKMVTLRMRKAVGIEFPVVVTASDSFLTQAVAHLSPEASAVSDIKAAAVYARTAFESVMSWYCAEKSLLVRYAEARRELDTNDFLTAIEKHVSTLRNRADNLFAGGVIQEVKHARRFILNPHSHYNPELEDEIAAEIAAGIRAVEDFDLLLRCVTWADFIQPGEHLEKARVGDLISASLDQLAGGRKSAALKSLARAYELHLDAWFSMRGELVPYGASHTPTRLFAMLGQRKYYTKTTWLRLKHSKEYLLGEVHVKKFEQAAFESAVQLILKLHTLLFIEQYRLT